MSHNKCITNFSSRNKYRFAIALKQIVKEKARNRNPPLIFFSQDFNTELSFLSISYKNIQDSLHLFLSRVLFPNVDVVILLLLDLYEIDCLLHSDLGSRRVFLL